MESILFTFLLPPLPNQYHFYQLFSNGSGTFSPYSIKYMPLLFHGSAHCFPFPYWISPLPQNRSNGFKKNHQRAQGPAERPPNFLQCR